MKKKLVRLLLVFAVLGCGIAAGIHFLAPQNTEPADEITLYGNVEIREVQLAFQSSGRIQQMAVDEGAKVAKGQLLAEIDPIRYQLEVERLENEIAAQKQLVKRLTTGSRPQEIEKARAAEKASDSILAGARSNYERIEKLSVLNKISQQSVDNARTALAEAEAGLEKARQELSLALEGPRKEDILRAEDQLQALEASLKLAREKYKDTKLFAPNDGIIHARIVEPGAVVASGSPVFTLALVNPLWVRTYISEPDLGRIQVGMQAEIRTDSYPDKVYRGWVGFISPQAEFTPKTVETEELRTRLVYRSRIFVCNDREELRLGMPVTVKLFLHRQTDASPVSSCEGSVTGGQEK